MGNKDLIDRAGLSPEAAWQQLDRILAHPLFNQSKRFDRFLRYVTELSLHPEPRVLSERDLGVELFGRAPNYDTEADPIVRVTASEIRKRLAKYYAEAGRAQEVPIELSKGSYLPEFHQPLADLAIADAAAPPAGLIPAAPSARSGRRFIGYALSAAGLMVIAAFWPILRNRPPCSSSGSRSRAPRARYPSPMRNSPRRTCT